MLNKLIERILGGVGKRLDGYKTTIGGIGSILTGIVGIISILFPDQGFPSIGIEASVAFIVGGFSILGVGGKADKQKAAIVAQTAVIKQQNVLVKKQNEILSSASPTLQVPPLPVGEGKGEGRSGRIEEIRPAD
ncbi:MAG: hypothetical protein HZB62_10695 [Nitrospirae bacterium]|nr:hypothetical protein [Nitrospirota bacterium]